jgi:hypothetical protein
MSLGLTLCLGSSGLAPRFHGNLIMSKPLALSGSSALLDKLSK